MDFANTLKNLREARNITQEQLADYLQVSRPTIAGYETKCRQPDFEKLEQLANFFQVSIDYLLTGVEFSTMTVALNKSLPEKLLNREVLEAYKNLSLESKQDVLKYIELLLLRDEKYKTK